MEIEDELQALKAEFQKETTPNGSLTIRSPNTWRCIHTLKVHTASVNAIAISPHGHTFVSGSNDKTVNLWDLKTGKWLHTFIGQAEAVLSVAGAISLSTTSTGLLV
ncbi:MAG: hypothetical protein PUP92_15310 [Rhizonema sp. PD38]|nr:hypothetical protein [Rhizonema sp. PD38]